MKRHAKDEVLLNAKASSLIPVEGLQGEPLRRGVYTLPIVDAVATGGRSVRGLPVQDCESRQDDVV